MSQDEAEAVQRFNDYMLSKTFGYTPQEIHDMPITYYQDYITIANIISARESRNSTTNQ